MYTPPLTFYDKFLIRFFVHTRRNFLISAKCSATNCISLDRQTQTWSRQKELSMSTLMADHSCQIVLKVVKKMHFCKKKKITYDA